MLSAAVVTPSLSCFGAPLLPSRIFPFPRHLLCTFLSCFLSSRPERSSHTLRIPVLEPRTPEKSIAQNQTRSMT